VCRALAELKNLPLPGIAAHGVVDDIARKMAESISGVQASSGGEARAVFLGNLAQHHPSYSQIHALAQEVAKLAGASFGVLGEAPQRRCGGGRRDSGRGPWGSLRSRG